MMKIRLLLSLVLSAFALMMVQGLAKSTTMIAKISGKNAVMLAGEGHGGDTGGWGKG
ncbi:hypothetical protein WDW37_08010 [Bdellovibrionota bacterium FG-1]